MAFRVDSSLQALPLVELCEPQTSFSGQLLNHASRSADHYRDLLTGTVKCWFEAKRIDAFKCWLHTRLELKRRNADLASFCLREARKTSGAHGLLMVV